MLGVLSGGFERFFQQMGTPADSDAEDQPPFIPDFGRIRAAAQAHRTQFFQDFEWPDA
jgi:quercetin 2,3-dioxygenase